MHSFQQAECLHFRKIALALNSYSNTMEKALKRLDKDYIHYMIETEPAMSVSKIVNLMKSYTTYHIWERYPNYLRKHFRKEHTFWTDGYFACSAGNVSEEMLKKYIETRNSSAMKAQFGCFTAFLAACAAKNFAFGRVPYPK